MFSIEFSYAKGQQAAKINEMLLNINIYRIDDGFLNLFLYSGLQDNPRLVKICKW